MKINSSGEKKKDDLRGFGDSSGGFGGFGDHREDSEGDFSKEDSEEISKEGLVDLVMTILQRMEIIRSEMHRRLISIRNRGPIRSGSVKRRRRARRRKRRK